MYGLHRIIIILFTMHGSVKFEMLLDAKCVDNVLVKFTQIGNIKSLPLHACWPNKINDDIYTELKQMNRFWVSGGPLSR